MNNIQEKICFTLFKKWNESLKISPRKVSLNYTSNAVLLGTISGEFRVGRKEIENYFKLFCPLSPIGSIDKYRIFGDDKEIIFCGHYSFLIENNEKICARFTFIYELQKNGNYLIKHHHSSRIP